MLSKWNSRPHKRIYKFYNFKLKSIKRSSFQTYRILYRRTSNNIAKRCRSKSFIEFWFKFWMRKLRFSLHSKYLICKIRVQSFDESWYKYFRKHVLVLFQSFKFFAWLLIHIQYFKLHKKSKFVLLKRYEYFNQVWRHS